LILYYCERRAFSCSRHTGGRKKQKRHLGEQKSLSKKSEKGRKKCELFGHSLFFPSPCFRATRLSLSLRCPSPVLSLASFFARTRAERGLIPGRCPRRGAFEGTSFGGLHLGGVGCLWRPGIENDFSQCPLQAKSSPWTKLPRAPASTQIRAEALRTVR
jgi:hypothetical protein